MTRNFLRSFSIVFFLLLQLPHIFVSKPNEGVKFYCKHRKSANTTSVLLHFGTFLAFFLQVFFLHDKHEGVICTTLITSNHSSQPKPKANLTPTWKAFFKQISRAITFWNSRFFPHSQHTHFAWKFQIRRVFVDSNLSTHISLDIIFVQAQSSGFTILPHIRKKVPCPAQF